MTAKSVTDYLTNYFIIILPLFVSYLTLCYYHYCYYYYYYYYSYFMALWTLPGTTRVSRYQIIKSQKYVQLIAKLSLPNKWKKTTEEE